MSARPSPGVWRILPRLSLLGLACWAGVAVAGVRISPLTLSLQPDRRAVSVTLRNEGAEPVYMQARVFDWRQDADAGMQLLPTDLVAVSPAMLSLAPGATQVVRLALQKRPAGKGEQYFRMLIDELPSAESASQGKVSVLTRYSVPLFIEPLLAGLPKLSVRLLDCAGARFLLLDNAGERRARIADWKLSQGDSALASAAGLAGYVLAGSQLRLMLPELPAAVSGSGLTLAAQTDLGPWQAAVEPSAEAAACPSSVSR